MVRAEAILKFPQAILRRTFGHLTRRDYHLAMLIFVSVFIFAFVANS